MSVSVTLQLSINHLITAVCPQHINSVICNSNVHFPATTLTFFRILLLLLRLHKSQLSLISSSAEVTCHKYFLKIPVFKIHTRFYLYHAGLLLGNVVMSNTQVPRHSRNTPASRCKSHPTARERQEVLCSLPFQPGAHDYQHLICAPSPRRITLGLSSIQGAGRQQRRTVGEHVGSPCYRGDGVLPSVLATFPSTAAVLQRPEI